MSLQPQKFSWPSWPQWKQLPTVLNPRESRNLIGLILLSVGFAIAWLWTGYLERTVAISDVGGEYSEAIVGEPQFINPLLAGVNDADKDIGALVYNGLLRYDAKGTLVPDLAQSYDVSQDGKTYTFFLRKDITWHDGKPFNANDVLFTIMALQNIEYGSPLRASWQGVNIEKIDDFTVKLTLDNPRSQFIDKLTLGIMPKHIWGSINAKNISLADANLKPIGTGPFRYSRFIKDKYGSVVSYTLEANPRFHRDTPYLAQITFYFYTYPEEALAAYKSGKVLGVSYVEAHNKQSAERSHAVVYGLHIPKYFSVFFNQNRNKPLADKAVRTALALATDKSEIVNNVFQNTAIPIDSPIMPWLFPSGTSTQAYAFSVSDAKNALEKAGWKDKNNDGIMEKTIGSDKQPTDLAFSIITSDFPDLVRTAEVLKTQWERIGAQVDIESYNIDELKQSIIKGRKYDALLFGEVLSENPDPYIYWHSSQKRDPGLNLAQYDNKDADKALEQIRITTNAQEKQKQLEIFQNAVTQDIPAVFLFSPDYLYAVHTNVKGITIQNINAPSWRFTEIEKWYMNTKRISK